MAERAMTNPGEGSSKGTPPPAADTAAHPERPPTDDHAPGSPHHDLLDKVSDALGDFA